MAGVIRVYQIIAKPGSGESSSHSHYTHHMVMVTDNWRLTIGSHMGREEGRPPLRPGKLCDSLWSCPEDCEDEIKLVTSDNLTSHVSPGQG